MKRHHACLALACLLLISSLSFSAQTTAATTATNSTTAQTTTTEVQVPHLIKFNGVMPSSSSEEAGALSAREAEGVAGISNGSSAAGKVVGMTFSLYSEQSGGSPLWSEVQNVQVDSAGHYTVQLGSTNAEGLPVELFTSAQAQWLGVQQQGQAEQPRIMLLSVPYALKAADAETFGGKPPSAYLSATGTGAYGAAGVVPGAIKKQGQSPQVGGGGTANYVPLWTSSENLGTSVIYQASDNNIGIGTTAPGYPFTIAVHSSIAAVDVAQTGGGVGIFANASASGGSTIALRGRANSPLGIGVEGYNTATTGDATGVEASTASDAGIAIDGIATAATGTTAGVQGITASSEGVGIFGFASSDTGNVVGVKGSTPSTEGVGVYGDASATNGTTNGVYGESDSPEGIGVYGNATASSGDTTGVYGVIQSSQGDGVLGSAEGTSGNAAGVRGTSASDSGTGVYGEASDTSGDVVGVYGTTSSPAGEAVYGHNTGESGMSIGVYGVSDSASGVAILGASTTTSAGAYGVVGNSASPTGGGMGASNSATTGNAYGIQATTASTTGFGAAGRATATTGVNTGVIGETSSSTGYGVVGSATSEEGAAYGVAGMVDSPEGIAILGVAVGRSEESGVVTERPIGTWGDTNQEGGIGLVGTADDAIAVGGYSSGNTISTANFENSETGNVGSPVLATHGPNYGGICLMDVSGNLACNGSKSAVVPVDGGARQVALYAVEAPENWFEDVGSGHLSHGAATVRLDPTFAQTVNGSVEYHVFLTPKGDCKGLYVTNETPESFEVRELGGGAASIAFDYRIMAHRKGYETIRLADNTARFQALANQHRNGARVQLTAIPHLPAGNVPKTTVVRKSRAVRYPQPPHVAKMKVEQKR